LGADRDGLRLAGDRLLHHQLAAQRRHERGARRHHRRRRRLHRAQHDLRHPLSAARPEGAVSERAAKRLELRQWLLTDTPWSAPQAALGQLYLATLSFARNRLATVGLALVLLLVSVAILAPLLAPHSPDAQNLALRLRPPDGTAWFGTDELGRDIFSRILYGARITLGIVALVIVLVGPLGLLVGCAAGYAGGWLDLVLMSMTDVFLAFPRL